MLKINDIAVIYRSFQDENEPHFEYNDGDVCVILEVFEAGTDPYTGREEGENYKVLNERTGSVVYLPSYVMLKSYEEMYHKPYQRKSDKELQEARKQAWLEWIEYEKQQMDELQGLYGTTQLCSDYITEIKELEQGLEDEKYTEKYFKSRMKSLLCGFNSCYRDMNNRQLEYRNELWKKYKYLL